MPSLTVEDTNPSWSPDGTQLVVQRDEFLWIIPSTPASGTGTALTDGSDASTEDDDPCWHPSMNYVVYSGDVPPDPPWADLWIKAVP